MRKFIVVSILLALAAPAFGWGEDGHRVIGWIAYQRLTPEARAEVDRLLAVENTDLPAACFWADAVARKQPHYRFASPLHYANVPRGQAAYDPERDRPPGGDVVSAIERYRAVLADGSRPDAERLEALRFLAHFVGDIHQPLHVGHGEDKGGNTIQVRFFEVGTNLHAVWDTGIIQRSGESWEPLARRLHEGLKPHEERRYAETLDPQDWAQESYRLAAREVYAGISPGQKLDGSYVVAKMPVVEDQLAVAGVRLAAVLNAAVEGDGRPVPAAKPSVEPRRVVVADESAVVYVTRTGKKYHAEGCRHLTDSKAEMTLGQAKRRYEPCKACRPPE